SDVLKAITADEVLESFGVGGALKDRIQCSVAAARARATLQTGKLAEALDIVREISALPVTPDTAEMHRWLDDVRYEAQIRTFHFAEALVTRRVRASEGASPTSRLIELNSMLDHFAPEPDAAILAEAERPFYWSDAIETQVADWLPRQREADQHLLQSIADAA